MRGQVTILILIQMFAATLFAAPSIEKPDPISPWGDLNVSLDNDLYKTYAPTHLSESNKLDDVSEGFLRHATEVYSKSDSFRQSSVGKAYLDFSVSLENKLTLSSPQGEERFTLIFKPDLGKAGIKYEGEFNFHAVYESFNQELQIRLERELSKNSNIEFRHSTNQNIAELGYKYSW